MAEQSTPEGLKQIEDRIPVSIEDVKRIPARKPSDQNRITVRFDPAPEYISHLSELIDLQPIREAGLNIMVDAMWGNGAGWFPRLVQGGARRLRRSTTTATRSSRK
jgi:phosphoglucomutase